MKSDRKCNYYGNANGTIVFGKYTTMYSRILKKKLVAALSK